MAVLHQGNAMSIYGLLTFCAVYALAVATYGRLARQLRVDGAAA